MTGPERLSPDPSVAVAAFRFPSKSAPGRTYDAALLIGEDCGEPVTFWDCTCWPFLKVDRCAHVTEARATLRREHARDERQAELDARLGCRHPLTYDEDEPDFVEQRTHVYRTCMGCGLSVDRAPWQERIEADIRDRHRLPSSPWTAEEQSRSTE